MGLRELQRKKPCGPDLHEVRKKEGEQRNKGALSDKRFLDACKLADVEPTKRQASKWNNKRGAAYARRFDV